MLTCKPSVRFAIITPQLLEMLSVVFNASINYPPEWIPGEGLMITSGSDGQHVEGSKHYIGLAIDVRSKTLAEKPLVLDALRADLGPRYLVLLEDAGKPNEHIHIQVR